MRWNAKKIQEIRKKAVEIIRHGLNFTEKKVKLKVLFNQKQRDKYIDGFKEVKE